MENSENIVLTAVEAFLDRHKMAPSRLGTDALGNPSFVSDLRKGALDVRKSTVDKLYAWMKQKDQEATFGYDKN